MIRTLSLVAIVALALAALSFLLFVVKLAFALVFVLGLCIVAAAVAFRLSFKRMRSTADTRPPTTT
jgi:hypothetical protein